METENINNMKGKKNGLIIPGIFVFVFFVYYTVMIMLSPLKMVEEFREQFSYKQSEKNKVDERIFSDSSYLKLYKEKAWLQSKIAMAETDSIYLTINLPDSTVNLEISGVIVHSANIKRQIISKILKNGDEYIISSLLARPFTISNNYSSIPKMPLMIKMAPKDTSEYKPDIIPDTADYEPVNYVMEMENGIVILVYQEEKLNPGDRLHLFGFDLKYRLRNILNAMKSILTFKVPEYHPFIKLRLPRTDSKIIYRALPEHGQIAVYR
ncbi:MAG: hypothetical protein MUC93_04245 [Bacteroidales bacterium]|jgi:hypothetical protein|nr:hypothetical protein [Bacteroidales bacterium]